MRKIDASKKLLVFTFDDGPRSFMPKIAEIFETFDGRATFFVVGNHFNGSTAEYVQNAVRSGHEIGCHGQTHGIGETYDSVYSEITDGIKTINKYLPNYQVKYFRSAGLDKNEYLWNILSSAEINLPTISYEHVTCDWREEITEEHIVEEIFRRAQNGLIKDGSVILCHELEKTVNTLPEILEKLYNDGFSFCTISEYLEIRNIDYDRLIRDDFVTNIKESLKA